MVSIFEGVCKEAETQGTGFISWVDFALLTGGYYGIIIGMSPDQRDVEKQIRDLQDELENQKKLISIQINRIWQLEQKVSELSYGTAKPVRPSTPVTSPSPLPQEKPSIPTPLKTTPVIDIPEQKPVVQDTYRAEPPVQKPLWNPPVPQKEAPGSKLNLETEIGGRWFSWLGVLALFLGLGFLFKFAVDQGWITELVRIAIGTLSGLTLLSLGEYLKDNKKNLFTQFSRVLTGGGLGLLYLTGYAAYGFYNLIGMEMAWVILAILTFAAYFFALRYDSPVIGILGLSGGLITPFLLGHSEGLYPIFYLHCLVMCLTAVALCFYRKWISLGFLGYLGGLIAMAVFVLGKQYTGAEFPEASLITFGLVLTVATFWAMGHLKKHEIALMILVVSVFFPRLLILNVMDKPASDYIGFYNVLIYGGILAVAGMSMSVWAKFRELKLAGIIVGQLVPLLMIPDYNYLHYYGIYSGLLIILGSGLYFYNRHPSFLIVNLLGTVINYAFWSNSFYAATPFGEVFGWMVTFFLLFNGVLLLQLFWKESLFDVNNMATGFSLGMIFAATSYLVFMKHYPEELYHGYLALVVFVMYGGLWFVIQNKYSRNNLASDTYLSLAALYLTLTIAWLMDSTWITVAWALESFFLFWLGAKHGHKRTRHMAMIIIALAYFRFFHSDYRYVLNSISFTLFFNDRFIPLIALVGSGFGAVWFYQRFKENIDIAEWRLVCGLFSVLSNLMLLFGLSLEIMDFLDAQNQVKEYLMLQQMSLSVVWALYAAVLISLGIWKRSAFARGFALCLFGIVILKVFLVDVLSLEQIYRIIAFFVLGIILLSVSYLYNRYKDKIIQFVKADSSS